ncbi:uncharacterized protein FYW61_021860 [Anableps anableps]
MRWTAAEEQYFEEREQLEAPKKHHGKEIDRHKDSFDSRKPADEQRYPTPSLNPLTVPSLKLLPQDYTCHVPGANSVISQDWKSRAKTNVEALRVRA